MKVVRTDLPEVLLFRPAVQRDQRGWKMESWQTQRYAAAGVTASFVQEQLIHSRHGVLRGLHLQPEGGGRLLQAVTGEVYAVAVDLRPGSPRFGRWTGALLSAVEHNQLWMPEGFAQGYLVTAGEALLSCKRTAVEQPEAVVTVRWDDPGLAIDWPVVGQPLLSERDAGAPRLQEIEPELTQRA
jgi:dTDP-4-dehydrorhamnose 3,5-epimerase